MMKKYVCYEPDFTGNYTITEMINLYNTVVDKTEYATFNIWLADMLKSGVFEQYVEIDRKYQHEYVCCLPLEIEACIMCEVEESINKLALTEDEKLEAIEDANNSKVCDLDDTIKIMYV